MFMTASQLDKEILQDLNNKASQDYVYEKLKDIDEQRFVKRSSPVMEQVSEMSSDRYVPKTVEMPDVEDDTPMDSELSDD